jgi:1,4-dihydroxy-2-naphthoate polyprenyltransferase
MSTMTLSGKWVAGARPKTLPAAVVPVVVGTAVAAHDVDVIWWRALFALIVGLAMQVAVNYANDYSDGIRGTDHQRVGPMRLVGSGVASPELVKRAALISFAVAAVAGTALALATSPVLLLIGVACVAAAWFYTGGSKPYGYSGFGELSVFVFFGLVAVCGSQFVQQEKITLDGALAATAVGLLAVALLVVNNLRDRANDEKSGKVTLAVRMGDRGTRRFYVLCTLAPFVVAVVLAYSRPLTLLALFAVPAAAALNRVVVRGAEGRDLIPVLQLTGQLQMGYGLLLSLGLWL